MTPEQQQAAEAVADWLPADAPAVRTRTDLGNAQRLVDEEGGDLRHVPGVGWLTFSLDGRWIRDETGEPTRRMAAVTETMLAQALGAPDDDRKAAIGHALKSQGASRIAAALELAAVDERIVVTADRLDAHPHLLSVRNGTVDLRNGALRPAARDDLLTLGTAVPYAHDAACPRWERFLREVFAEDTELISGVQRLFGYILTGYTREQALPVFYGDGANGKSVAVEVLEQLLGDLAVTAAMDTFLEGQGGAVDYDLARLRGARLVVAQESGRGRRLADAVVKRVTGGDTITARHPYGRPFSYRPAFTAILVTNHRPRADATDEAIWRRLRLVPFEVSFRGREDRQLAAALTRELTGILAWAVRGAVQWHERGLDWPQAVTAATAAYRADEDPTAGFLADECRLDPAGRVTVANLRSRYETWAHANGERPISAKALTQALAGHGITAARTNKAREYRGLHLIGDGCQMVTGESETSPTHPRTRGLSGSGVTTSHLSQREEDTPDLQAWAEHYAKTAPAAPVGVASELSNSEQSNGDVG